MTLTERVLRHLEETRGEWHFGYVDDVGHVRPTREWDCPLESYSASIGKNKSYAHGCLLGPVERKIFMAADKLPGYDPALRAAMLEAAGLAEESEP